MKPTILFLSRLRRDTMFIDTINNLKNDVNVVVMSNKANHERYSSISGIAVEKGPHEIELAQDCASAVIDSDEISKIEKELGINCYEINSNYFLYRKFTARYGAGHANSHINANTPFYVREYYRRLRDIVDKHSVQYCFFETMDLFDSVIMTAMAKQNIITQAFEHAIDSIGGQLRLRLASGQHRRSPMVKYIYENKLYSDEAVAWAEKVIASANKERKLTKYDQDHINRSSILPKYSLKQVINRIKEIPENSPLPALIRIKNRLRSAKYFSSSLPDSKYLAYFLQLTPEASMCAQVPELSNQEFFLEQIAIAGKYGYELVIKEHPACYGNRSYNFYKELSMLPNVTVLPPSFDVRTIIRNSTAVIVATGTNPGLESIVNGVPVLALGNPHFNICKNVHVVKDAKEIWAKIDDLEFDTDDQKKYLAALYESSSVHPQFVSVEEWERSEGVGTIMADALRKEISLYESGTLQSYYP